MLGFQMSQKLYCFRSFETAALMANHLNSLAKQQNWLSTQSKHSYECTLTHIRYSGRSFYGPFADTAIRFGIAEVLERWTGTPGSTLNIKALSSYLTVVTRAGLAYLLNFSLMRVEEAWNLRANCLTVEKDPRFERYHFIARSNNQDNLRFRHFLGHITFSKSCSGGDGRCGQASRRGVRLRPM